MGREHLTPDLCVVGAGSGGLSVAAGAAQMGASVVLVEKGRMGGDCLNFGCVPSKALLAAAHAAANARDMGRFGVSARGGVAVDFAAVMDHVRDVIAGIAPHDSQERFESLGCTVLRESARFIDARHARSRRNHDPSASRGACDRFPPPGARSAGPAGGRAAHQ